MKRLARLSLSGCLIASLGACTGPAAAPARPPTHPAPSPTHQAPVAATSAATAVRPVQAPAPAPPATTESVVAVVAAYYRAIVARSYQKAFGYLGPGATGPDGHGLTLGSFLQLAHQLDGMGGPVTQFSIGGLADQVVMTLYRVRYGPYHAHLRMVRTGHGWAIGSIDRI